MTGRPPSSTLFPYTTLFRSRVVTQYSGGREPMTYPRGSPWLVVGADWKSTPPNFNHRYNSFSLFFFLIFFNDRATTEFYSLSLHDALPISGRHPVQRRAGAHDLPEGIPLARRGSRLEEHTPELQSPLQFFFPFFLFDFF